MISDARFPEVVYKTAHCVTIVSGVIYARLETYTGRRFMLFCVTIDEAVTLITSQITTVTPFSIRLNLFPMNYRLSNMGPLFSTFILLLGHIAT